MRSSLQSTSQQIPHLMKMDTSVNLHTQSKFFYFYGFDFYYLCFSYTNYQETKTGWLLWTKKTTTQSARSVTTVAQNSPEDECPIVWRKWPWTKDDSLGY